MVEKAMPVEPVTTGMRGIDHPLLDAAVDLAADGAVLLGRLSPARHPWLADVAADGGLPAAVLVDVVLAAARHIGCGVVEDLVLVSPVVVPTAAGVQLQVLAGPADDSGRRPVRVFSRQVDGGATRWTQHVDAVVTAGAATAARTRDWAASWPPAGATPVRSPGDGGSPLPRWRRGDESFAEIQVGPGIDTAGFTLHPTAAIAVLQSLPVMDGDDVPPSRLRGARAHTTGVETLRVRISPAPGGRAMQVADCRGRPVFDVDSLLPAPAPDREHAVLDLAQRLGVLPAAAGKRLVARLVRERAAAVLACAGAEVPMGKPLSELGFDSLNAVELGNALTAETGLRLPMTVVFDHPTLAALADHIHRSLVPAREAAPRAAAQDPPAATALPAHIDSASDEEIFALIDNNG